MNTPKNIITGMMIGLGVFVFANQHSYWEILLGFVLLLGGLDLRYEFWREKNR